MKKYNFLDKLNRRRFIRNSVVAATGSTFIPLAMSSCEDDATGPTFEPEGDFGFFEGVASFDPGQDSIVLWSRYTPANNETEIEVLVDVAIDADFDQIVASERVEVDINSDYTLNVDVSNLASNTKYFYRFRNDMTGAVSITGETITLPNAGEASEIKFAVVSCANYQAGLFNTYGAVAESEADIVIHLGDYIYEYGIGEYGTNELTASLEREHTPSGEIVALDEYRARYRQYRSDEQLQRAHQIKPFICVWDDHEVTNDAYKDGAQNHQDDEGDYETRKMNAIQAWHEYLPARVNDNATIYRNFEIGDIVNLLMLDTRIVGRDKQLDYQNYFTQEGLDANAFAAAWQDPNRTILGQTQLNWLTDQLSSSNSKWQVLGTQVLMGKYFIPAELLTLTAQIAASGTASASLLAEYTDLVTELLTIKSRIAQGDPTVTDAEKARVETTLPYNLDAWDGYPAERETIFATAKAAGKKLVTLAGDTHNAWHSDLSDFNGDKVGVEYATASVSSPGFEGIFGDDPLVIGGFEQANIALIDDLLYSNASDRGYLSVTFSSNEASAEWRFISTLANVDIATSAENTTIENF